jgi:hypothetical protein
MALRLLRFAFPALLGCALFAACGDDDYDTDRANEDINLELMALTADDIPYDMPQQVSTSFDNEEWAEALSGADPEIDADRRLTQLEAQGRIRNQVTVFAWESQVEHLGRPRSFESHSTLYGTNSAASEAIRESTCGLPIPDSQRLDPFRVAKIGAQATGFSITETLDVVGDSQELVICFRTGRIVHAVVQSGLDGTQDIALSVRLAERMLRRVDAALE